MHVPASGGKPALISLPRDCYVPIPGHGSNKINAAFAFGGPNLLVQTVEQVTDLHIDGYVEIGFAGFASVVDSVGGVNICVPLHDERQEGRDQPQEGLPGPRRRRTPSATSAPATPTRAATSVAPSASASSSPRS